MKLEDFTPDQQKAITASGNNIIVSAGAGSGKTEVLTQRVAYFINEIDKDKRLKINEFLILTFTNLAASEMKERIRKKLIEIGSSDANNVDTAHISTFDSYAFFLVKKYHYLLNLSKDIKIIDTAIIDVKVRELIDEILADYYQNEDPILLELVKKLTYKDDNTITSLIAQLYNNAVLDLNTKDYLNNYLINFYNQKIAEKIYNDLYELANDKIKKLRLMIDTLPVCFIKKDNMDLQECALNILHDYFSVKNIEDLRKLNLDIKLPPLPKGTCEEDKKAKDTFSKYLNEVKNFIKNLPVSYNEIEEELLVNKKYAEFFVNIVKELYQRLQKYKEKYQVYEFSDIAKFANKLINEHDDIRNEIKNSFKMIMIDEYQDTSILQEEFIKKIANNNLYMVGDVKQSIYRFRNARCDIFIDKYIRYKELNEGIAIDLNANFRSRKEVLEDINLIFSDLMTPRFGGADYKKDHIIDFGNKKYEKSKADNQNYHLDILTHPEVKSSELAEKEARIIATDIIDKINNHYQIYDKNLNKNDDSSKLRDATYSDFCILIDRGTSFDEYVKVFNEYKIPLSVENDEDIKDNLLVLVLKNLLKLLQAIDNDDYTSNAFHASFVSIARSFIYEYSDTIIYQIVKNNDYQNSGIVKDLKVLLNQYRDLSLAEKLEKIIFDLRIHEKLIKIGDVYSNERYLELLLDFFNNMSLLDYNYGDFIKFIDNISEYNLKIKLPTLRSTIDSVRLMNIHKSKGLEFSICYFAGYNRKVNLGEINNSKRFSKRFGLIIDDNHLKVVDDNLELEEIISEYIRLFYVALTRTKEKMIIVCEDELLKNKKIPIDYRSFYDFISANDLPLKFHIKNGLIKECQVMPKGYGKKKLKIDEIEIDNKPIVVSRASKQLKVDADSSLLDLGTELHFIFEAIDFMNPNYELIDIKYRKYIKSFLESTLISKLKNNNGIIYKEYEYYDSINLVRGIIDLMIVYDDYIDIIDYKTKNIDDEAYNDQLNAYRNYIKLLFNKEVHCYLYSIIDQNYREVQINE